MTTCTAFPGVENRLKELVVTVDADIFRRERINGCSSDLCRRFGMCCSLTVAVTSEEADVISALVTKRAGLFTKIGHVVHGSVFRTDRATGRRFLTKKRRPFRQLNMIIESLRAEGGADLRAFMGQLYTCVFSMEDGSCALQRVSEADGRHKWYYKPVNCWKYPLGITGERLMLTDRRLTPYFPCCKDGAVLAVDGLREELEFMGKIIGRDLLKEIRGLD